MMATGLPLALGKMMAATMHAKIPVQYISTPSQTLPTLEARKNLLSVTHTIQPGTMISRT